MKQLLIIGASGHGKAVADIAKLNGYENILFFDDNENVITSHRKLLGNKGRGYCKIRKGIYYTTRYFFYNVFTNNKRIFNWLYYNDSN